jgi:gluconokinase
MAPPEPSGTTTVVVMGVSGSGKSTVAAVLVERLGWEFAEGDDFHPPANVEKMRAGRPLDDDDRRPWLLRLADWIGEHERAGRSAVITCSALKRSYRTLLRDGHPSVWFAHVTADPEVLRHRITHRAGHYMPAALLDSQLATLQPLDDDEPGARISGDRPPEDVVDHLLAVLALSVVVQPITRTGLSSASEFSRPIPGNLKGSGRHRGEPGE